MDNHKDKVIENFSKHASSYVTSESHAKGEDLPRLIDWLEPEIDWISLDIATGGGHVAKTLSPYVKQVFSTDITRKMLETAQQHLSEYNNIFYCVADAEDLPFLNSTFDCVTCRIAPHHFPNPELFIKEVSRVLKPYGQFILIDNIAPEDPSLAEYMNTFEGLRDKSHVRCLTFREWEQLFQQNHFKTVKKSFRKKKYQFEGWVTRTTDTETEREIVKKYVLNGTNEQIDYFNVESKDETLHSMEIDEVMVMCVKG